MTTEAPAPATRNPLQRLRRFTARHGRGLTVANIFTQGGIIVTGGAVRLTGSGLGCSTWPQCEPGTFVPELRSELGIHPYIEFGNRTLTFVLLIVAIGVALALWDTRPDLKWWGLVPVLGVVGQAIVGGITVLADLNPVIVAPHLLLSMGLVWQAVWLALKYREAPRREGRCVKTPLRVSSVLLVGLLVLGTVTTGAGPHSGDAEATERLGIDLDTAARAHALVVWAFVAIVAYLVFRVRNDRSYGNVDEVGKAWKVLVGVTLAQGVIGYVQYFNDLPELIVGAHLAGAAVLTAAHSAAFYLLKRDRSRVMAEAAVAGNN
ncbi:COX15/CtaA family protein [Demequina sp. TTPB684]|uniref:COX15/CtaA family protein n=1 Tax=unclassified Demequina TaxID=2620311 RepID=UPI001CF48F02|nr:COX15/CtaA family protein [Demequina sp. TMPB413]MCB2413879.1 COX15/CtaA family protein [Demequina sp. TTPB684]UPU89433.1 COX15/CtaA family protein [Demequina sp. TMPB413]